MMRPRASLCRAERPVLHDPAAGYCGAVNDEWPVLCPHCSDPLSVRRQQTRLRGLDCSSGHHFTAAKQGYVNLLVGKGTAFTPDTAEMIMARERVQDAGLFDPLSTTLSEVLEEHRPDPTLILDAGAGTGHHLGKLLETAPGARGLAIDLSPAGLRRAAKLPRTLALAWDLWRPLPLAEACSDVLLTVFAPRNPEEYARVLCPGGLAVVVTPRPGHLKELAEAGLLNQQKDKHDHLLAQFAPHFGAPLDVTSVTSTLSCGAQTATDLVAMGPAGHHRSVAEIRAEVETCAAQTVTADLDVTVWRR